jgi:hypothetical protein
MTIRRILLAAAAACALGVLASPAIAGAGDCKPKDVMITSTRISVLGPNTYGIIIAGACLDQATNVLLAYDLGTGFQNVPFGAGPPGPGGELTLAPQPVTRPNPPAPPGTGQYLLQLMQCKDPATLENCKVLDSTFVVFVQQLA